MKDATVHSQRGEVNWLFMICWPRAQGVTPWSVPRRALSRKLAWNAHEALRVLDYVFSKSLARYLFAAFHSGVLTFIQPDRVPDR